MSVMIQKFMTRFRKQNSGAAAVEFSLIVPFLGALFLGLFDVGTMVYDRTDLHSAARSGAQYFMAGGEDDLVAQELISRSWSNRPEGSTVSVTKCCKCAGVDAVCTELCPDDSVPDIYHNIEITSQFNGLFGAYEVSVHEMVRSR